MTIELEGFWFWLPRIILGLVGLVCFILAARMD